MTVFQSLLNHDFIVSRRFRTLDHQGGWHITYTSIVTIEGRLRPASSTEIIAAQQEQRRISHVFYCEAGRNIARGDRISADGVTVDVMAVREPSRANEHYEIDCLETQQEESETGS
jgi:SPP1 family predicted phage head-tail adaptor